MLGTPKPTVLAAVGGIGRGGGGLNKVCDSEEGGAMIPSTFG